MNAQRLQRSPDPVHKHPAKPKRGTFAVSFGGRAPTGQAEVSELVCDAEINHYSPSLDVRRSSGG